MDGLCSVTGKEADENLFMVSQCFLYSVIKINAMLKIGNLKAGDIINVDDEGIIREGTIVRVSHEENQALVDNGVQEF